MVNNRIGKKKKKPESDHRAFQAAKEESHGQPVNSEMSRVTKEQLEHLYKHFQSPQLSVNHTCSLAQKVNYLITALVSVNYSTTAHVSVSPNSDSPWIIDFGATDTRLVQNYSHLIVHVQETKRSKLHMVLFRP